MAIFGSFLMVLQVLSAISVIVLVLLQHGKGADMGAAFGGGSSGGLFGATGAANFLSRTTAVCATIFFLSTLGLSFASQVKVEGKESKSVMESVAGGVTEGVTNSASENSTGTVVSPADIPVSSGQVQSGVDRDQGQNQLKAAGDMQNKVPQNPASRLQDIPR